MPRLGICLLLLGLLGGCAARTGPPAPVDFRTGGQALSRAQPAPGPHPDRVTVAGGETLYGIAHRTGVPVRAIIDANNLKPPYLLLAGSTLILPQVRAHVVQGGETMTTVARLYGVEASSLAAANHLEPPFVVRTGQTLILPATAETVRAAPAPVVVAPPIVAGLPPPAPAPVTIAPPFIAGAQPPAPVTYAPPAAIASAPPAPIAATPLPWLAAPEPQKPAPEIVASVPPPANTPQPSVVPSAPAPASPPPENVEPPPPQSEPSVVALGSKGFVWPVRGRVLASFGTGPQGTHNDGINIAAAAGTTVVAADAGEVAYAGNELKGYGNLVLVKHDSGFITAYAHNETLLVKRGQRVTRGQPIAKVGATGTVSEPQLHFEVRRGARVLDPMEYLPAQAATASR
jgi:murein DD-endopeptidase MepM/ murein hydrolase activator NlpD